MFDGYQRKRKPDHNAGHSRDDNSATAACEGHHRDSDRQSCQCSTGRGEDERHGKKRDGGAQKQGGSGPLVWNCNQHPYGKRRDELEHLCVSLVMAIESCNAEVSAGRSGYSEALKAYTAGFLYCLSWDRGFSYCFFPMQLDSQAAAL